MSIKAAYLVPHPPIILPEVGRGEEAKIAATHNAYLNAARDISKIKPDLIIILSPHARAFADYIEIYGGEEISGNMSRFRAPSLKITAQNDLDFAIELARLSEEKGVRAGIMNLTRNEGLDHGAFIPLYYINKYYTNYKIILCGISGLSEKIHFEFGKLIKETVNSLNRNAVLIASGDLSHRLKEDGPYGFNPDGSVFDKRIIDIIEKADLKAFLEIEEILCDNAAQCALKPLQTLAGALDGDMTETKVLSCEGPFGVGYSVAVFNVLS